MERKRNFFEIPPSAILLTQNFDCISRVSFLVKRELKIKYFFKNILSLVTDSEIELRSSAEAYSVGGISRETPLRMTHKTIHNTKNERGVYL